MGCYCYYGEVEFYRTSFHIARKEHRCDECFKPIEPGEEYNYSVTKQEGDLFINKMCMDCAGIADALQGIGYCVTFGGLIDDYQEYFENEGIDADAKEILMKWRKISE